MKKVITNFVSSALLVAPIMLSGGGFPRYVWSAVSVMLCSRTNKS